MRKVVVAIVSTSERAEALASRLTGVGFDAEDISVLLPDARRAKAFVHELHTRRAEGALTGIVVGAVVGAAVGLIGARVAIPGLGALVTAGAVMASLSGAAVVAALLGGIGALVGAATPRYEARMYEGRLRDGNVLFSVYAETYDRERLALDTLRAFGARDVSMQAETPSRFLPDFRASVVPVSVRPPRSTVSSPSP